MGTQGPKRTDACGALKAAGTAGKRAEQVPHVGSQRGHIADPSLYKHMSNSAKNADRGVKGRK
jgi:hypothetical protein